MAAEAVVEDTAPAALAEDAASAAARPSRAGQRSRSKSAAAAANGSPEGGGNLEVSAEPAAEASRLAATAGLASGSAPGPVSFPADALAAVVAGWPSRSLTGTGMRLHAQMVAFTCRQTEASLAAGNAMLASRSWPALLSAYSELVGRTAENTLAHLLELTRLSAEALRDGAGAGR